MKNTFTLIVLSLIMLYGHSQNKTPKDPKISNALNAAQDGLVNFLENIPEGFEKQHGFNSRNEFRLAKPSSIYSIFGVNAKGEIFRTNLFNISISVNGEYRAMITVSSENEIFAIETIGASLLAKELQVIEQNKKLSGEASNIMLNFYENKCGFIAFENNTDNLEKASFIPLISAKMVLDENKIPAKESYPLEELKNIMLIN